MNGSHGSYKNKNAYLMGCSVPSMWSSHISYGQPISPSAQVYTRAREFVSDNLPAFHDKFHSLEFGDVGRGIAGDCNEIGKLAFLDGPHSVLPANIFCAHRGCRTDRLQRCHPVFNHSCELYGFFSMIGSCLFAMGPRGVYRESDLDASLERSLKACFRELCHWEILALCLDFSDGESECHEYALFNYHPDRFRIDVSDKFERVAARLNGLPHGNAGMGGAGHSYPLPVCFIHNRLFFFQRHGRGAIAKIRICPDASRVDLDKISSVLELYPHLLASFIWRVHEVEVAGSGDRSP